MLRKSSKVSSVFLGSDLQIHVFKQEDYKTKTTGLSEASKGGCVTDISMLSGSQAVQGCVPSSMHFGVAWEQLRPSIYCHSSNILLHLSPHTYQCHQVTRRPVSRKEGGRSDTGSDVLLRHLMDVSRSQLEFIL